MQLSVIGALIFAGLLLFDRLVHGRLIVALMASLAFGATAVFTLSSLGGASPPVFTLMPVVMGVAAVFSRHIFRDLAGVFRSHPASTWSVLILMVVVVCGAIISPRLFAGEVIVFVVNRSDVSGGVEAALLSPSTYNITQAGYLAISAFTYLLLAALLQRERSLKTVEIGFFSWAAVVALSGLIGLSAKIVGLGDVLEPLRTANYAAMTSSEFTIAGFFRVSGLFSEASAYGASAVAALAFMVTFWRYTRNKGAFALSLVLFAMVVFSTSSTAYATLVMCCLFLGLSFLFSIAHGQVRKTDIQLLALAMVGATLVIAVYLAAPERFEPLARLIDVSLLSKASSDSAIERSQWNLHALDGLIRTYGLGVGIGSTRTSSWLVAVVSHLGVVGAALVGYLCLVILRGVHEDKPTAERRSDVAVAQSARAATVAWLIAASLSSPSPDPGILFFVSLASILACRSWVEAGDASYRYDINRPDNSSSGLSGALPA